MENNQLLSIEQSDYCKTKDDIVDCDTNNVATCIAEIVTEDLVTNNNMCLTENTSNNINDSGANEVVFSSQFDELYIQITSEKSKRRCFICNNDAKETRHIDGLLTTASRSSASNKLRSIIGGSTFNLSNVMCIRCLDLLELVDQLEMKLDEVRSKLRNMYESTVTTLKNEEKSAVLSTKSTNVEVNLENLPSFVRENDLVTTAAKDDDDDADDDRKDLTIDNDRGDDGNVVKSSSHGFPKSKFSLKRLKDRKIKCPIDTCSRRFRCRSRYMAHLSSAHAQRPSSYTCSQCGKKFNQKYYLTSHVRQVHEGQNIHGCDGCGKVFLRRHHLEDHLRAHVGEKPHQCYICSKAFTQRGNLKVHMMVHNDVFNYQCDLCGKQLRSKQALEMHQRTHDLNKQFRCNICEARFTFKRSLERHSRKHTGERPFTCSVCPLAFRDKGDLRCHLRIHKTQRDHVCPICGKGFHRRYKMQRHLAGFHDKSEKEVEDLCLLQHTAHQMLQRQGHPIVKDEDVASLVPAVPIEIEMRELNSERKLTKTDVHEVNSERRLVKVDGPKVLVKGKQSTPQIPTILINTPPTLGEHYQKQFKENKCKMKNGKLEVLAFNTAGSHFITTNLLSTDDDNRE